ncbi:MAG TPA: sigma factor, partial [Puia sp.]
MNWRFGKLIGLAIPTTKITGNKEDASDIVQEIFLSLWNRRASIEIAGSLAAYLYTSVRYKTIHYIEKNITRKDY